MRNEDGSGTLPSSVDVCADDGADGGANLDRSLRSVADLSARVGHLVKRAMMSLESDAGAAHGYLKEASALLDSELHDSASSAPTTGDAFQPRGLMRWKAKRALEHIEASLESKMDVWELANVVGLSRSHFAREFKLSLGLSPMAYVATRRVERAKVLMTQTRKRLIEIALACGFSDQAHLGRSFRRMVGVSPGRWRRVNSISDEGYAPSFSALIQDTAWDQYGVRRNPRRTWA